MNYTESYFCCKVKMVHTIMALEKTSCGTIRVGINTLFGCVSRPPSWEYGPTLGGKKFLWNIVRVGINTLFGQSVSVSRLPSGGYGPTLQEEGATTGSDQAKLDGSGPGNPQWFIDAPKFVPGADPGFWVGVGGGLRFTRKLWPLYNLPWLC